LQTRIDEIARTKAETHAEEPKNPKNPKNPKTPLRTREPVSGLQRHLEPRKCTDLPLQQAAVLYNFSVMNAGKDDDSKNMKARL
jgi:hypothetical protein